LVHAWWRSQPGSPGSGGASPYRAGVNAGSGGASPEPFGSIPHISLRQNGSRVYAFMFNTQCIYVIVGLYLAPLQGASPLVVRSQGFNPDHCTQRGETADT
jgi:hypothetical protein